MLEPYKLYSASIPTPNHLSGFIIGLSSPNKAARDQQRQPIPYELRMENRVRVNAFGHGYGFLDLEANAI